MENHIAYAKHINADEYVMKWVNTTLKNYVEEHQPSTEEVEHILDYLVQTDKKIERMSYPEAKKNAEAWTKSLQKKGKDIDEKPEDTEVVLDFKDGFKIVKLVGQNAYKREGYLMRHCVADYYGKDVEVYSLRDQDNMPHCTMEKDSQVKGKGNGNIHPKYVDYVVKFLEHVGMTVGDSEMKHLGYINISEFTKDLSKETLAKLYDGKYIQKGEQLIGKDGKEYFNPNLLNIIPLLEVVHDKLRFNFDVATVASLSFEWIRSKSKKVFDKSHATTGYLSHSATTGDDSHSATTGRFSHSATTGNFSHSATTGRFSHSATTGDDSIAASLGIKSKAKSTKGNFLVLSEYEQKDGLWKLKTVKTAKVDGKKIKEDVWYELKNGKFVESKEE